MCAPRDQIIAARVLLEQAAALLVSGQIASEEGDFDAWATAASAKVSVLGAIQAIDRMDPLEDPDA